MVNIIHRIGVKSTVSQVYKSVTTIEGIAGWWTRQVTGHAEMGGMFDVEFRNGDQVMGAMRIQVTQTCPDSRVVWSFVSGPPEWMGTEVVFDIKQEGDYTIVLFSHNHWREAIEFMSHCSTKWATFLISLRDFVETGIGMPSPNDQKIDNWN